MTRLCHGDKALPSNFWRHGALPDPVAGFPKGVRRGLGRYKAGPTEVATFTLPWAPSVGSGEAFPRPSYL